MSNGSSKAKQDARPGEDDIVIFYKDKYYMVHTTQGGDELSWYGKLSETSSDPADQLINAGAIVGNATDSGGIPGGYSAVVNMDAVLKAVEYNRTALRVRFDARAKAAKEGTHK